MKVFLVLSMTMFIVKVYYMITLTTKSHVTVYYFLMALPGLHISLGVFHNFFKNAKG